MHILFITGEDSNTKLFRHQIHPLIEGLKQLAKEGKDITIATLSPGPKTLMQINEDGVIQFQIKSVKSKDTQIPKFTPSVLKDINNFFNEFKPDLVHSFDQGFIGLITQSATVSKKIPYLLSITENLQKEAKLNLASKVILGLANQVGISSEFISNFYKNSTSIISNKENLKIILSQFKYKGRLLNSKDITKKEKQLDFYRKMIKESERKSQKIISKSTVLTAATIVGSLLAFAAISTVAKLKSKKNHKQ